jgi:hypothetical protein
VRTKETGLSKAALQELRVLHQKGKGALTPEAVLSKATSAKSALHSYFTWDDTEAAQRYRLEQARGVIRSVRVELLHVDRKPINVRAFVSLPSDRGKGAGYQHIVSVMRQPGPRAELLAAALAELGAFRKRYADLAELAGVFEEIDKIVKKSKAKKKAS